MERSGNEPGGDGRRTLAGAALRPLPLVLLAGGAAGAALAASWPIAGAGLLAYLCGVALSAGGGGKAHGGDVALVPPEPRTVPVRSTEVMARVVRIRKGHEAFHKALCETTPSVRRLLADGYRRLCDLTRHAYDLALKADKLRAQIDRDPSAAAIGKELEEAQRCAGGKEGAAGEASRAAVVSLGERLDACRRLEREHGEALAQLESIASALEGMRARVVRLGAEAPDRAEEVSREVASEIERMDHVARALEEAMRDS